jgi:hypothetical protein
MVDARFEGIEHIEIEGTHVLPTQLMQLPASTKGKAPRLATSQTFSASWRATAKEVPTSSAKPSCTSTLFTSVNGKCSALR